MIWGKTKSEKERIREAKRSPHSWYAWHPVKINDGRWVWCRMLHKCVRYIDDRWAYIEYTLKDEEIT